jgi:RHS repeat-associated protein
MMRQQRCGILKGHAVQLELPNQYAQLASDGNDNVPLFNSMDWVIGWATAEGDVTARSSYDPFGQLLSRDQNWPAPFGFAGYFYDNDSKLYHLTARSYHPRLGRFLQRDPLGLIDGMNLYSYSHHSPGTFTDHWGFLSNDVNWVYPGREFLSFLAAPTGGPYLTGQRPTGTLHLWSETAPKLEAIEAIRSERSGWMMGDINGQPTPQHEVARGEFNTARAAEVARNPGVEPRLSPQQMDRIWGWRSAWVVGRGAFSGYPVTSHGQARVTTSSGPGNVQGDWEIPARQFFGSLGGSLAIGSGMYSALRSPSFGLAGLPVAFLGINEATSGLLYLGGAILGSTAAMRLGTIGMRAFGGAGLMVSSLAQLPGDLQREDVPMIISNTAGLFGGALMLAAAFGPAGWTVLGGYGLALGLFSLGGHISRAFGLW